MATAPVTAQFDFDQQIALPDADDTLKATVSLALDHEAEQFAFVMKGEGVEVVVQHRAHRFPAGYFVMVAREYWTPTFEVVPSGDKAGLWSALSQAISR